MSHHREPLRPSNPRLDIPRTFDLPYSIGIKYGGFVLVSGMSAVDPQTGERRQGDMTSETLDVLANLAAVLADAGASLADVVKVNVFLHSLLEAESFNAAYRHVLRERPPARNVSGVVLNHGMKVEVDCIALATGAAGGARQRSPIEPRNPLLNNSRRHNRPHSPGIRIGDLIFVSGMVPLDPQTGETRLGPTSEQIKLVLSNMAHLLESAQSSLDRVLKLNVSLANMLECDTFWRIMRAFFPHDPPACTVVGMQLSNGHAVEIECVAAA